MNSPICNERGHRFDGEAECKECGFPIYNVKPASKPMDRDAKLIILFSIAIALGLICFLVALCAMTGCATYQPLPTIHHDPAPTVEDLAGLTVKSEQHWQRDRGVVRAINSNRKWREAKVTSATKAAVSATTESEDCP